MEIQNNNNNNISEKNEPEINLSDIFVICMQNWYWIILSIFICVSVAALYIEMTPPTYTRSATIMIKDDKNGSQDMLSAASAFSDLGISTGSTNVDNELHFFTSKRLMEEVVKRLELDVSYKHSQGLKDLEYYKYTPIAIKLLDKNPNIVFSFNIKIANSKKLVISNFEDKYGEKIGKEITTNLNDTVLTPFGKMVFCPTLFFSKKNYEEEITIHKSSLKSTSDHFNTLIQVSLADKKSSVINLSINDQNTARAEDILNTLIDVHNSDYIQDKNKVTISTAKFINERIEVIKADLSGVDSKIEEYKKDNKLTDIVSETTLYMQSVGQLSAENLNIENQLSLALYMKDYVNNISNINDLLPANTGIGSQGIQSQINEYNTAMLKRNQLFTNGNHNNPIVEDLNNSLTSMRSSIKRSIENLIEGLKLQISNMKAKQLDNTNKISSVPTQQKYVISVQRQQKIKEELYLYLLKKSEENDLQQAITASNCRIIDMANGPLGPIAPKTAIILLASLIIGLFIPVGVYYISTLFNNTVTCRKDLEDETNIPFLGEIPLKEKIGTNSLVIDNNSRDMINESFRIVRSNLDFMLGQNKKVVTFTSLSPSSGKSFISTNLAKAFALTNKKVILIDLDIRKATLSKDKQIYHNKSTGITTYLSGKFEDINEIISKSNKEGFFDLISCGPIPPNPAELLMSPRLDKLIEELKDIYDIIFIDCVPYEIVADMSIVNRISDVVIYIARSGLLDKRYLPRLQRIHDENKLNNLCLILNGVKLKHTGYGYGYGYGYRYGYGNKKGYGAYGYGNDDKKK